MLELNKIYCGDSAKLLRDIYEDSIDLVVTSPPYDSLRTYNGYLFDFEGIAMELFRVIKPGGVVCWVIGDETRDGEESGTSFRQALFFKDVVGFKLYDTMIYEKTGSSYPSKGRYTSLFDYIFVLSKGKPKTFNPIKDVPRLWEGSWGKLTVRDKDGSIVERCVGNEGKAKSGRSITDGQYGWKQRSNIWRYVSSKKFCQDRIADDHPATFPEKLAGDCIYSWSNPGDVVLDPFVGSGTTLKMSILMDRRYIGIDCSQEYCEISRKRVESAISFKSGTDSILYNPSKE